MNHNNKKLGLPSTAPAHSSHEGSGETQAGGADVPSQATKSQLLAQLMSTPGTYDRIDSAWRLVMRLMLVENGTTIASYRAIACKLGSISKSTVKKWADGLVKKGIIEREQKGKLVELRLKGDFMEIARAPDVLRVTSEPTCSESAAMLSIKKMAEGAEELGGQLFITVQGCKLDRNKC